MKELSIEEKAKAYDEAIKRAKEFVSKDNVEVTEYIFPELAESEYERIRKDIISFVEQAIDAGYGIISKDRKEKWIAWLEKQDNLMKALQISNAKIGELIEENYYLKEQLEKQGNNMGISEATKQKLEDNLNKALQKETPESWNKFLEKQGEQKPTIEMITPEESLGIDSDTYNKIVDECVYGEQKHADKIESRQEELTEFEKAVKQVMEEAIECGDTHNLKVDADMLLRLVQNHSWSEEDEEIHRKCICAMRASACGFPEEEKFVEQVDNWLKSLRSQSQWKPTLQQINALSIVVKHG